MKSSCHIIQDLLPLYHDGVCSKESEQLVKEHLQDCEDCKTVLAAIDENLEEPVALADDDRELRMLQKTWKRGIKKSFRKGIRIGVIAAACIVVLVLTVFFVPIPHYYNITYGDVYHGDGTKADVTVELKFWKLNYLIPKDRQKGTLIVTDNATGETQEYFFDQIWPMDKRTRTAYKELGYNAFGGRVMPAILRIYAKSISAEYDTLKQYQSYGTRSFDETLNNLAVYISYGGAEQKSAPGEEAVLLASADNTSFEELTKDIFFQYLLYYFPEYTEQ